MQDCRTRAHDCVERAQDAKAPDRAKLLELARAWLELADEAAMVEAAGRRRPPESKTAA
jgi:hypothetical protein